MGGDLRGVPPGPRFGNVEANVEVGAPSGARMVRFRVRFLGFLRAPAFALPAALTQVFHLQQSTTNILLTGTESYPAPQRERGRAPSPGYSLAQSTKTKMDQLGPGGPWKGVSMDLDDIFSSADALDAAGRYRDKEGQRTRRRTRGCVSVCVREGTHGDVFILSLFCPSPHTHAEPSSITAETFDTTHIARTVLPEGMADDLLADLASPDLRGTDASAALAQTVRACDQPSAQQQHR